jgi:uncharacterized membrane protein YbhN (UPF0104 family)
MRWALRVAALVAVAIGLVVAVRGVSVEQLGRVLRSADLPMLGASALVLLAIGFSLRAARFRAVLGETPVPFHGIVGTMLLCHAANNVLPLRAGELVRTREFVAAGHPIGRVVAAQGAEKLIEATTFVLLCAPVVASIFGQGRPSLAIASVIVVGVPLLVWIARRVRMRPADLARAFGWALVADAFEIVLVSVTLHSLGLAAGLRPSITVLGAVNLAILLPSTPASLGAFEAGAALALVAMGVAHDEAVAFALLYRVVQWVPVTLAGGAVWAWRMVRGPASLSGAGR